MSDGDESALKHGTTVRFGSPHHNHNSELKKHEGDRGVVKKGPHRRTKKYLVKFTEGRSNDPLERFWVDGSYLEVLDDAE